jgi:hypothetical protein
MAPMKRLDLDDLPPKAAALLAGLEPGEELILMRGDAVMGRLTGGPSLDQATADPPLPPEENAKEIFEQFRSIVEDEF